MFHVVYETYFDLFWAIITFPTNIYIEFRKCTALLSTCCDDGLFCLYTVKLRYPDLLNPDHLVYPDVNLWSRMFPIFILLILNSYKCVLR